MLFLRKSSLYRSFEWNQIKVPVASPWLMNILYSWLNITFIQLSTRHRCFSLTHFNLNFSFCLWVLVLFSSSLCTSRLYNCFLRALMIIKYWWLFQFICFSFVHFLFSMIISLTFLFWYFNVFRGLPVYFPFLITLFLLHLNKFQSQITENNQRLLSHKTVVCLLDWVLQSFPCSLSWGCRIHRLHICRGVWPPQQVSLIWH